MELLVLGISVVTACHNERENLQQLIPAIRTILVETSHEIIVVDDSSSDGTIEVAKQLADVAVSKERRGQTRALADGMNLARYDTVITMDSDLENNPKWIPNLADKLADYDIVVASRARLPRVSERLFSRLYQSKLGVHDILSNYRAYRKSIIPTIVPTKGETFGAEFLLLAQKQGYKITEIIVEPEPLRRKPRIGTPITANLRCLMALARTSHIR